MTGLWQRAVAPEDGWEEIKCSNGNGGDAEGGVLMMLL